MRSRRRGGRLLRAGDGRPGYAVASGLAARGSLVLLGDPGRAYLPRTDMIERARYIVPTSRELEDHDHREAIVRQVLPG
jgi:predicted nicotinamide N-methyase